MFGSRTLLSGHTLVAVLYGSQLAVRLGRSSKSLRELLAAEKATAWDPTRRGRPYRDWGAIEVENKDMWLRLANEAWDALAD